LWWVGVAEALRGPQGGFGDDAGYVRPEAAKTAQEGVRKKLASVRPVILFAYLGTGAAKVDVHGQQFGGEVGHLFGGQYVGLAKLGQHGQKLGGGVGCLSGGQ